MSQARVKGTVITSIVKYLRRHREQAKEHLPSRLQSYLEQRILATSWHPEEDYLELMRAVVKIRPRTNPAISAFEDAARAEAPLQFEGPYKALLRSGDPARTLQNFPSIWGLRHDTGKMVVEREEGGQGSRVTLEDYGLVHEDACASTQGTMWGMVELAGGRNVDIQHTRCRARGDDLCEWKVSWA